MSFPAYVDYKDSEVEWVGQVPLHWEVDRFKRSTVSCRNGIWGKEAQRDENDIPCVRVADFDRESLTTVAEIPTVRNVTESERCERTLSKGNLLLEKSGGGDLQPVGFVVLYDRDEPAVCSNFVAKVELAEDMDPSFWRYCHAAAYSVRLNYKSIKQTSGIQNLDQSQYLDERAPFPPLDEQKAISSFLDMETSKIDGLVSEQRRLIELLKEKRQAVISHAVTKGLNANACMKPSGIQWLGDIPQHWEVLELKRLIKPGTSITYGIVQAGPDIEGGIPYIRTSDMSGHELPVSGYLRTSTEIDQSYSRSKVSPGDLVVAIRATLGKGLLVPDFLDGANLTQGTAKVSPGDRLRSRFLFWAFNSAYCQLSIDHVAKGTTFREITLDKLRRIRLIVPTIEEQEAIVEYLDERIGRFNTLQAEAERAIALLKERRTALISAAVTGKIDVREYASEEAVA